MRLRLLFCGYCYIIVNITITREKITVATITGETDDFNTRGERLRLLICSYCYITVTITVTIRITRENH
jgi:hypothetical protein